VCECCALFDVALITPQKNCLVALLKALFARICFKFEISGFYKRIFCFAFSKEIICSRNKAVIPDLIPPHSIYVYTRVLCAYYTNTYLPRYSPSWFFGPFMCLVPTPGLTSSTPGAVCARVRIHTHTPTHTSTSVKLRQTQDNTSISPSVKNKPPRQAISALYRLVEFPNPRPPLWRKWTNCEHTSACAHPALSDCVADMFGDVKNTCGMYTPACTGA